MQGARMAPATLESARHAAARGWDDAAKATYLDLLRDDPTSLPALCELGALASASSHRSAARTAFAQAVRLYPTDRVARVSLANILVEDGALADAARHFQAALALDPDFPPAHQGMARLLAAQADQAADRHWQKGFAGHSLVTQRYRGEGQGVKLLLLVSARCGNMPTRQWIDDRSFAVTAIYADFHDPDAPLPPHALVVNAIGDADLCGEALRRAEIMLTRTTAPVINPPALVRPTGRAENAQRLAGVPGIIAPRTRLLPRASLLAGDRQRFPLLLRTPGFHTGEHFVLVETPAELEPALAALPGESCWRSSISTRAGRTGWRANIA